MRFGGAEEKSAATGEDVWSAMGERAQAHASPMRPSHVTRCSVDRPMKFTDKVARQARFFTFEFFPPRTDQVCPRPSSPRVRRPIPP